MEHAVCNFCTYASGNNCVLTNNITGDTITKINGPTDSIHCKNFKRRF